MTDTASKGAAYYAALGEKNIAKVKEFLHPNIEFCDPQEKVVGREAVLKAAERFSHIFKTLTVRTKFGSKDQAMIVYDVDISGLTRDLPAASLLSFQDGLISKIELIYDTGRLN